MSRGHVLRNGVWVSPDDDLVWREESFGEYPDVDEILAGVRRILRCVIRASEVDGFGVCDDRVFVYSVHGLGYQTAA